MSDPRDLLGAYVRAVHGWNRQSVQGEGKAVAYSEGPQYLIETASGRQFWWREHLVEVVPEEARKSTPLVSDETPDQVTLDDLPATNITELVADRLRFSVCYRCSGLVPSTDEHYEAHERWHAAIEDLTITVQLESTGPWPKDIRVRPSLKDQLTASGFAFSIADVERADAAASAQSEEFQPLRHQLIEAFRGMEIREWGQDAIDLTDKILPVVEPWAEKYLHRATVAEAETERLRLDLRRTNDLAAVLRGQVAELEKRRQDCAEKHTPLFEPPFGLREQLLAALQVQDTGQDIVALVRELRTEYGKLELAAGAEPVSPSVAGIIDAQNVALLRLAARGRRAYATGSSGQELKILQDEAHAFDLAAGLIEDPRMLGRLIPTSMQTWSLDDDVAEIVAKATGIRVVLLDPQPEPAAEPEHVCAWTTDQVNARVDERRAEIIALLELAARGREAYAQTASPTRKMQLRHEAKALQDAIALVRDPAHLGKLCPDSMLSEGTDQGDTAEAPPCQSKFLYQPDGEPERLLWCGKTVPHDEDHYHFLSPGHGVRWTSANQAGLIHLGDSDAEGITDEVLSDLLLLVGVTPSAAQLSSWTDEQREQVARWAGAVHLDASDNDVDVPERPAFLDEPAAGGTFDAVAGATYKAEVTVGSPITGDSAHPFPYISELARPTAEVCPSLYYRELDRTLYACNAIAHPRSGSGADGDVWHNWTGPNGTEQGGRVPWTDEMAVAVPWPLDQEPPAGINTLRAVDTPREEDEPTFTLRRHGGGWVWQEGVEPIQSLRGHTWAEATERCGELHVVRP